MFDSPTRKSRKSELVQDNSVILGEPINDVDMTYSSFPTIDNVMFTHIFDLPM